MMHGQKNIKLCTFVSGKWTSVFRALMGTSN